MIDSTALARVFNALSNPRRVDIFSCILKRPTLGYTFGEIAQETGIPASSLSHHLKEMETGGVLTRQPQGVKTIFKPDTQRLADVLTGLMAQCCVAEHPIDKEPK